LLRKYKNSIHQEAGINTGMLAWMSKEAMIKILPPKGYQGGLIFDSIFTDFHNNKYNSCPDAVCDGK
jgi:hypothetical protein